MDLHSLKQTHTNELLGITQLLTNADKLGPLTFCFTDFYHRKVRLAQARVIMSTYSIAATVKAISLTERSSGRGG